MRERREGRERTGGRETIDESPDREDDGGEKDLRARIEREEKGERVREEGDRGEEARREMSHTILKGLVEGNRLSVKAGAVRAGGLRERERAENDSISSTLTKRRRERAISEAGKVRGRKTREEGGESSKARSRRKRTRSRKSERDPEK